MKKIKITRWGISKLVCIKAIRDLMDLTLQGAKDVIENSEMPCVLEVHNNEKLETFVSYTQSSRSGMEYTIEDSVQDIDITKHITMSRTELVENFTNAINNVRAAFSVLMDQNDEVGNRYNKVCAEASMLQAEVEKLKANNNNDLCIQLREEIARLKRDNDTLREEKKVVEANNDSLMIANKSLQEDVQRLKEVLQAIKNLAL